MSFSEPLSPNLNIHHTYRKVPNVMSLVSLVRYFRSGKQKHVLHMEVVMRGGGGGGYVFDGTKDSI